MKPDPKQPQKTGGDPIPLDSGEETVSPERKTLRKPTNEELHKRVRTVFDWLCSGKREHEIERLLRAEPHNLSKRSAIRYLARARDMLVAETKRSREEHRAESLATYRAILDDPESEPRDRVRAQERIDKLLGLEIHSPKQVEISGPDGAPIQQQTTVVNVDLASKLQEYLPVIRAAALRNFQERLALQGPASQPESDK